MTFSIATWNINSVRLRMPIVERLLREYAPDVLCLQETKVPDDLFPFEAIRALGYDHIEIHGQKGYHGVATISRTPIEVAERRRFCEIPDSRHLSVRVGIGARALVACLQVLDQVRGRGDADVGGQERGLELLDRLVVEGAAPEDAGERPGEPVARGGETAREPFGPRAPGLGGVGRGLRRGGVGLALEQVEHRGHVDG